MTATYELRRLLDERGVEWTGSDTRTGFIVDGIDWEAYEHVVFGEPSGLLSVMTALTPAQAIDATLGRGTCEVIGFDDGYDEGLDGEWFALAPATWFLSCDHEAHGRRPSYCPVCGRKVVK